MSDRGIASRAATGLCLAAAPTFAALALLTGGSTDMLCMGGSPFSGMGLMYGLMAGFHLAPWLKLFAAAGSRSQPVDNRRLNNFVPTGGGK